MLGVLRKLHAWAGLGICLFIAVIALSGASLAFKPQWLRATVPHAGEVATVTPVIAGRIMTEATARFGPDLRSVVFAGPDIGVHEVTLKAGGAYLAQDGGLVQQWPKNGRAVDWLFDLHHHLLSGELGTKVAGTVGILAAAMILTGFVLWLPARRSFRARLTPRGDRAGWLSAHRDLGVMVAPLALVMTMTGAGMALDGQAAWLLGFERPRPPVAGAGEVDWNAALGAAMAQFPNAQVRIAIPPAGRGKPALVRLRQPGEWHANGRTLVYIDPATNRVLRTEDAMTAAPGARVYNALWPVHASKVGGSLWKLVTLLTGISLAALSLYGAEAYRRKLMPGPRRR